MMKWMYKNRIIVSLLLVFAIILACGCSSSTTTENGSTTLSESTTQTTTKDTSVTSTEQQTETTPEDTSETSTVETSETSGSDDDAKGLAVHFIDVDQGDASLVICDGEAMLIDGGSSDHSELIYAYLKKLNIQHLKYIVGTHPDEDHIGGLAAALNFATVERAFCSVDEYDSRSFSSFQKYLNKQKVELEIPEAGTELALGSSRLTILAPIENLEETNNNSIVIRLEYGSTSFLFTGDAEYEEESSILLSEMDISSTVLKVGHHGSQYSTSEDFLDKVSPSIAVISCGYENSYGFPKQDVLDMLKNHDVDLYRTDLQGDIIITCDGENVTVSTEKTTDQDLFVAPGLTDPDPGSGQECDYICNIRSHKFHLPNCEAVRKMKEANKLYFTGDRQELIDDGYSPCRICNP